MCGIVGLFLKDESLESDLGGMLSRMLATMCDRTETGQVKMTVQSPDPARFEVLESALAKAFGSKAAVVLKDTHAVIRLDESVAENARKVLKAQFPDIRLMASGRSIEIYKEVGLPTDVADRFGLAGMSGTHGIGHTRMATESAVTTMGAHPFSTDADQCLVHNGSLSNHNNLRRELKREGRVFETENDTEVAAAYLSAQMDKGLSLGGAMEKSLGDLDGFYTFVVGTRDGFGVLRDPIACKPAVLAETDRYVAFGSEYRALAGLPGIEKAKVWEPEPATVYFWGR
jgi:glutamate synthase domain-containing protein 1